MRAMRCEEVMSLPKGTLLHVGGLLTWHDPRLLVKGDNMDPVGFSLELYEKPGSSLPVTMDASSWFFVVEENEKNHLDYIVDFFCWKDRPDVVLEYVSEQSSYLWRINHERLIRPIDKYVSVLLFSKETDLHTPDLPVI
jgi:hypothetical protein